MAMTSSERQRKYRKSRSTAGENGERLINTYVTTAAALELARLAHHHGITKRAMLEQLIEQAGEAIRSTLDTPEWDAYIAGAMPRRRRRGPENNTGDSGAAPEPTSTQPPAQQRRYEDQFFASPTPRIVKP